MMLLFEFMYPGAIVEFIFDQSSVHGAFAPDALNAKEMSMGSGRNQQRVQKITGHSFPRRFTSKPPLL